MKRTIIGLALVCTACGPGNLDYVKANADARWASIGYQVVGYEGYQWGSVVPFTHLGGACVWYQLKTLPDNGIRYTGYLTRWQNELMVYGPNAIDAIKP